MLVRISALISLLFLLTVGGLAVTGRSTVAQAPDQPASAEPPPQPAPLPAAPAPVEAAPVPAPVPAIVPAPAVTPPAPAPIVTAPAPAVVPPAPAPSPVVTVPPPVAAPPIADVPPPVPAPVVTAPPPVAEPPAAAIAPAEAPALAEPPPLPQQRPAAADKKDLQPAKALFSAKQLPSIGRALAIGYYPRGCLQGAVSLPVTGPTWQVMRLSRNRNWGHPALVQFLETFAPAAAKATGWKGILVGDMAQPRGGPTPFGHMSHQTGLDVDVWFMPMPDRVLTPEEREKTSAINLVSNDWKQLNPKTWTPQHVAFIKTAAEQPGVERVLVNAAIKKELCRVETKGRDGWMAKVRPWYGHHDHIHVRLKCPADSPNCRKQPPVPEDDGCSAKALDYWFSDKVLHPKPKPPGPPPKPLTLADLPPACKTVLDAPEQQASKAGSN